MIKKSVAMLAVASVLVAVSCKENAATRIDDETAKKAEMAYVNSGKKPVIKFESTDHDFGTIKEGDKVEHVYKFTNTGDADLVVTSAKASCGCTVPSYTQTPVKPGGTGEIKAVFDSSGKPGMQQKTITVTMNTEKGNETLNFKANVTPKAGGAAIPAPAH
ncbi:hypothetical protein CHU92_06395 [Flavobacterium cyanobacteriorum]|uniref:DUF1573 domain-containing protein n=1 Tax=Flavobacterium cyanobacteriorum TaxID=2022802 RepID=A0A255Z9P3_9FLAO|nr:DUF1573 domain-containing protein [Flavobacterium cyanobacteriorum]OYQ38152.1 hypothetical protein CHU92_06395 [Flavobacterium cyanobacteriorum]